jgi:protein ImuA
MSQEKAHIIAQLQKKIFSLQGYKHTVNGTEVDIRLGPIKNAFPGERFPVGAIHEFLAGGPEDEAATSGFITGILAVLMQQDKVSLWISSAKKIFPPGLKCFGIDPGKIIFVDLQKPGDILWTMEEALKCNGLAAVIGEVEELSFTVSRRLQLAVEQSQVTGFILRQSTNTNTTACVTRWKITSLPSVPAGNLPGIGYPSWNVELLKIRNGRPGKWEIEWRNGYFQQIFKAVPVTPEQQRQTG